VGFLIGGTSLADRHARRYAFVKAGKLTFARFQSDNNPSPGSKMSVAQKLADMRQELSDLEKALKRQDPPLAPHTRAIAEAKIVTLERQITAMLG